METETTPRGASPSRFHAGAPPRAHMRHGKIEVSAQGIARVAGRAASQCYGVVGMASRRPGLGGVEMLSAAHFDRGVEVRFVRDHVAIEVYVVIEYGLRISEVARNLIKEVKYAVESALGLHVVEVNVNVQGLRLSDQRAAEQ